MILVANCGTEFYISDKDYPLVKKYKWRIDNTGRVACYLNKNKKNPKRFDLRIHRVILGDKCKNSFVDHIDGNPLNNRRSNLRLCNNAQNCRNRKKHSNSKNKYKGVCFHRRQKKWTAKIMVNYKRKWLGTFETELEAAIAYDKAAVKLHGRFARTNKQEVGY